jgi:uncharacterized protein with von Willebrand factor type A (vWA) domain
MYPFGALPDNLAAFCGLLRREYGFHIGAGEVVDAVRAIDVVDLSSQRAVRSALRTVLTGTLEDVRVFDTAFDKFFLFRPLVDEPRALALERDREPGVTEGGAVGRDATREPRGPVADAEEISDRGSGPEMPAAIDDTERAGAAVARASYSPLAVDYSEPPEVADVSDAWMAAARVLVRRVRLVRSRKWRSAAKGRRFDLRRTLRASLETGGEPIDARWLARTRSHPRFIVLIDGSRSMGRHAGTALTLASALARVTSRVEVFTFSTALRRVTSDIAGVSSGRRRRLRPLATAWGGGTTIGACLTEFLRRFGDRLLSPDAVVFVASDGLDVGEADVLRSAMADLHRRSSALVWLNPLLETPGYEPTALGMRVAKPFVTTFMAVTDPAGLVRLSRSLHVRR